MRLARLAGKRAEFHYTPPNSWEDPGARRGVGERSRQ
jgi:hypothetical protein